MSTAPEPSARHRHGDATFYGYGVGLRRPHFDEIDAHHDSVDCLELLAENFMRFGGKPRTTLERISERFPIVLHSVAMSIGGLAPLDEAYLAAYATLAKDTRASWASDHLCFSGGHGVAYHDLLPVPFTEEALTHVVGRIQHVQSRLPIPFAVENPSYYLNFPHNEMTEAEFLTELTERADCGLLLDVNNVFVNSQNHGYDPVAFIDALPADRIMQLHMAGHEARDGVLIDTHGAPVCDDVWALFAHTLSRTGPVTTILEWDNDIPSIEHLVAHNAANRVAGQAVHGDVAPCPR
jgi:uncharacterized protein (UPF0276 family)